MVSGCPTRKSRLVVASAGALIALGTMAAYFNSFSGAFVFDDPVSIRDNPTIRHLWPLSHALSPPPGGRTVSGRPVLNLSFAINEAFGGSTWGYHAANLAIHVLAALALFGIVRRTLVGRTAPEPSANAVSGPVQPSEKNALWIAFTVALLWAVHPLQTESVTYIVQRAESLMGLWYLFAGYCFIRGAEAQSAAGQAMRSCLWYAGAAAAFLLGIGTKEVIVSLPVILFAYDRTFLAGSFREAWRRRRGVYLTLAVLWLVEAWLVLSNHDRGGTAGLDTRLPSYWCYWASQGPALMRYLRLAIWPAHQVIDYGFELQWYLHPLSGLPADAAGLALVALTGVAFWRRPALGFLGIWFFAILAPTAVVPGTRQSAVEHRMYLALAPVLILLVLGADRGLARIWGRRRIAAALGWGAALTAAAGLAWLTVRRNEVYQSDLAVWADAVAKQPGNASAQNNLGYDLMAAGRLPEAVARFEAAQRLGAANLKIYLNLGECFEALGQPQAAIKQYQAALRLRPDSPDGHADLGRVLGGMGRTGEAIAELERAERLSATAGEAYNTLGVIFLNSGQLAEAERQLAQAVRLRPGYAEAWSNLGLTLNRESRPEEAVAAFQHSLRLKPGNAAAHYNLALTLRALTRIADAAAEFRQAVRLLPDNSNVHNDLGTALAELGQIAAAEAQFAAAVKLDPRSAGAHHNHGLALQQLGHRPEAIAEFRAAVALEPENAAMEEDLNQAAHD